MENANLLTVVVPTINHFEIIDKWIESALSYGKSKNLLFYILISDSDTHIELLKSKFQKASNVKFKSYPQDYYMEDKISSISSEITSKFVYACGDGILPNFDVIYELVSTHDEDTILLIQKNSIFEKKYRKMKEKDVKSKLFYYLTFTGGSIIKRDLFVFNTNLSFKSNFLYPVTVMNNLSKDSKIKFELGDFYISNPLKKKSTRSNSKDIVDIWTRNFAKSVFSLNANYDDVKIKILKGNDDEKFTLRTLLVYKLQGSFDLKYYKIYMDYYKLCGHKPFNLYLTKLIPMFLLKVIKKIKELIKR